MTQASRIHFQSMIAMLPSMGLSIHMHGECEWREQSRIGIIIRLIQWSHILFVVISPTWWSCPVYKVQYMFSVRFMSVRLKRKGCKDWPGQTNLSFIFSLWSYVINFGHLLLTKYDILQRNIIIIIMSSKGSEPVIILCWCVHYYKFFERWQNTPFLMSKEVKGYQTISPSKSVGEGCIWPSSFQQLFHYYTVFAYFIFIGM